MTALSSSPRGERAGRPGTTWNAQLVRHEHVVDDDTPDPAPPNRATRRAMQRAGRQAVATLDGTDKPSED